MQKQEYNILCYRIFNINLLVYSESVYFQNHIECFMKNLEDDSNRPGVRLAIYEYRTQGEHESHIQMCSPEAGLLKQGTNCWITFRHLFIKLMIDNCHPFYMMHASSVSNSRGEAALLVGVSDAGKTSAMIGMLDRGYRMVCDDYSLIRFEDEKLVSLPVGCTVTEKTFELFPQLHSLAKGECKFWCQGMHQWTINPSDIYPHVPAYETVEPSAFFFLYPNHGGESSIRECTHDEALWGLYTGRLDSKNLTPPYTCATLDFHQRSFELACSLTQKAKFYKVTNGQLHDTVSMIAEAFEL